MARSLLSKEEQDALMELFGTVPKSPEEEEKRPPKKPVAASEARSESPEIARSVERLGCEAREWEVPLRELTGNDVSITLKKLLRLSALRKPDETPIYQGGNRLYAVPVPLVNLINEKSLGALNENPMLMHPLSPMDKTLFETTGSFFCNEGKLQTADNVFRSHTMIEAVFEIDIKPLLRTVLRVWYEDESV